MAQVPFVKSNTNTAKNYHDISGENTTMGKRLLERGALGRHSLLRTNGALLIFLGKNLNIVKLSVGLDLNQHLVKHLSNSHS